MTDFHLDQHYGTAGPLGEFDYVGYYDYTTCWNTSNTAKFAFHQLFGILGARFATHRFGERTCDSPLALVTSAADFMASYQPPDLGKVGKILFVFFYNQTFPDLFKTF